jgi:predicted permease
MFRLNLKHAIRVLLNNRSFAIAVLVTFAFSIGVNTTIFSLREAILNRTIQVADAENLVAIYGTVVDEAANGIFSRSDYAYYKQNLKGVSDLAAHYSTSPMTLSGDDKSPQQVVGGAVSGHFFSMLGLRPVVGRFFLPDEDAVDGRDAVAVLSHGLWTQEYGADPSIVGKRIKLNGTNFTVIGVAPANFRGIVAAGSSNDLWVPLSMSSVAYRYCDSQKTDCRFLDLVGRLANGNSVKQLQSEVDLLAQQLEAQKPESARRPNSSQGKIAIVMPQRGIGALHRTQLTRLLDLLRNSAFVLLLIACVNVSGLFLVQMSARAKEMAMRLALGSNQRQLYLQMLTETGLLSLLGGIGGLLMSYWLSGPLSKFPLVDAPNYLSEMRIDLSLIAFTIALVTLCAILATIIPAIRMSRSDLYLSLKDQTSGGGSKASKAHDALVVAQVALSLALVAGGGLMMMSLRTILSGPGFDPSRLAFFRVTPRLIGYSPEKSTALQKEIMARLSTLPGVESVSMALSLPWWPTRTRVVYLPGKVPMRDEDKLRVEYDPIAPKYLSTLQIPLIAGREFNEGDTRQSPKVVIINESLAALMFPNENAIGRTLVIGLAEPIEYTVVGVSKDAKYHLASVKSSPYFYFPYWQVNDGSDARFCIRTAGDLGAIMPAITREIQNIDRDAPVTKIVTMDQGLKAWFSSLYLANRVLLSTSGIACFLSMLGLYSLIAFSVVKRNREIGIRIALGATRRNILRLMIQRGVALAAIGAVLGIGFSIPSLRIFDSLLYGVKPANPLVLITATIVLLLVSLMAGFLPAQRATKIDPIKVIRDE